MTMSLFLYIIDPISELTIAFGIGFIWIMLSWFLRRGNKNIRYVLIPFQIIRLLIPFAGWILTPFSIYYLYINKESKQYFKKPANQRVEPAEKSPVHPAEA